jgi:hypothetical protein
MIMGKHDKNKSDTTPAAKHVDPSTYEKTGGGKHRPAPDLTSGHLGSRGDSDGKSSSSGWGGDRSVRE